ncbi:IDEAL domain-containing protein [Metabacillus fastidiosus]|uniref:IDEAL domain-containing protein n=1 Tax=Metabacillus fastidiosus TaxID=1458 RepID=UPI003D294356
MKNKKSSTDIMNSRMNNKDQAENAVLDMYIQMVLDEAILLRRKMLLEAKINDALDRYDREAFLRLSEEYKKLRKFV